MKKKTPTLTSGASRNAAIASSTSARNSRARGPRSCRVAIRSAASFKSIVSVSQRFRAAGACAGAAASQRDAPGAIDPSSLLKKFTVEELQMHHVQNQEFLRKMIEKQYKETGKRLYKVGAAWPCAGTAEACVTTPRRRR